MPKYPSTRVCPMCGDKAALTRSAPDLMILTDVVHDQDPRCLSIEGLPYGVRGVVQYRCQCGFLALFIRETTASAD